MRPKKKCEECPRIVRTSKLIKNRLTGQLLCSICNKRIGSNKFYNPKPSNRYQRISNFSITENEKKVLMRGKSKEQIRKLCVSLGSMRRKSKYIKGKKQEANLNNQIKNRELGRKFLEGLNVK